MEDHLTRSQPACIFRNVLAALSALLFVVTAMLWVRSYWVADVVGYVYPAGAWAAHTSSYRGVFRSYVDRDLSPATDEGSHFGHWGDDRPYFEYVGVALPTANDLFGALELSVVLGAPLDTHAQFGFVSQRFPSNEYQNWTCQLPAWFILILSGCLPTYAVSRWRRRRERIKEGRCVHCGRDRARAIRI